MPDIAAHQWLLWTLWSALVSIVTAAWVYLTYGLFFAWRDRTKP